MSVELRVLAVIILALDVRLSHAGMKLAGPQNVKITSINMGAVIEWRYPHNPTGNITFTTRYVLKNNVTNLCMNTKEMRCDAGNLPYIYGNYVFQVRAEDRQRFSDWVAAPDFRPNKHTTIGPPSVHLEIKNNVLEVHVQEPKLKIDRLVNVYSRVSYVIRYWVDGFEESAIEKKINRGQGDEDVKLTVKALNLWGRYCVQAQVIPKGYYKESPFSDTVCVTNIPVLICCVIAAAVLLPLVLLVSWMMYKAKEFLYPKTELPDRFSKFEVTQHTTNQKEQLDKISAIFEDYGCEGHVYEGLSTKAVNLENKCCLAPVQEMDDDYKHLFQLKPTVPTFYPNHLYPLCLRNKLLAHLNQPTFEIVALGESNYYNLTDTNFTT